MYWRKIIIYVFAVLLPAIIVGVSNFSVFPDSSLPATLMLVVTVGIAGVFTHFSGDATAKVRRYCILADVAICAILCLNLGGHWILAREVSAARQGVEERYVEEDREEARRIADAERRLKLADAEAKAAEANAQLARDQARAANAERKRLATLPIEQRRSVLSAPKSEPATTEPVPSVSPLALVLVATPAAVAATARIEPRMTPKQVRESWWWFLTALAIAECAASVLAGIVLSGVWEWDRNKDGIPDHLQADKENPFPRYVGKQ